MLPGKAALATQKSYGEIVQEIERQVEERPELTEFIFRAWEPRRWRKRQGRTHHYPHGVIPIHPMPPPNRRPEEDTAAHSRRHWQRIRRMTLLVESEGAGQIPPILLHEGQLVTGTHRWIVNELLERRGKTEERIRVVELQDYPPAVRYVITMLFNAKEHTRTQPAFHLMTGIPLERDELAIKEWIEPALWGCCDIEGNVRR